MNQLIDVFYDSRRWAKIVGIISIVLFLLSFINLKTQPTLVMGMVYVLISVFSNLLPGLFLLRYAKAVGEVDTSSNPSEDLEIACLNQGRYFKVIGIVTLLMMIFVVIAFVSGVGTAMSMIR